MPYRTFSYLGSLKPEAQCAHATTSPLSSGSIQENTSRAGARTMNRMDFLEATRSAAMAALPGTARPARHVRPTIRPSRLRMHEMRCSVLSMPALLSSPKSPSCAINREAS